MALLEHLPAGQIQQVGHVPGRQPAFRRLGLALALRLGLRLRLRLKLRLKLKLKLRG